MEQAQLQAVVLVSDVHAVTVVNGEGKVTVCGGAAGGLFTGAAVIVVQVIETGSEAWIHRPHPVKKILNI
ncbi:Uncharacterised protein [Escherichia coli]|nr:Uncharacterised protein [Escherichia coli]